MDSFSTFFFPAPSFARGAGSIMDLGGLPALCNNSPSPAIADSRALNADAWAIYEDLELAVEMVAGDAGVE